MNRLNESHDFLYRKQTKMRIEIINCRKSPDNLSRVNIWI